MGGNNADDRLMGFMFTEASRISISSFLGRDCFMVLAHAGMGLLMTVYSFFSFFLTSGAGVFC